MLTVPVIDFSAFLNGTDRQRVADDILQASQQIGFFYLSNVGIADAEVTKAFRAAHTFFQLPASEKNALAWQNAASNRGYIAVKRETLDPTQKSDLKEAFNLGTQWQEQDPSHPAKNKWPTGLAKFKEQQQHFIRLCTDTANQVLRALALSLHIDEEFFVRAHDQQEHTFRLLHYPPIPDDVVLQDGENRAGAHTDYGSITLLFQDDVGGLEVKNKSGDWVTAPSIPGTVVVNTGDLMQRWTNNVISSNPHRVRQPEESRKKSRYSLAYFCTPNRNQLIETLPGCAALNPDIHYEPVTTQIYMEERLNRTY